jgi:8-oxo-dGTP pyrophosphatase MutT (NUDIX family)
MKASDLQQPHKSGAGCLIVAKDTHKFLLIQRSDYIPMPLTWSLPGGKLNFGESPEAAARREIKEEIGISLDNIPLVEIYTNDVHSPRFRFHTFACVVEKEFVPNLNWESSDYMWCDVNTLPSPIHWGVTQLINFREAGIKLGSLLGMPNFFSDEDA